MIGNSRCPFRWQAIGSSQARGKAPVCRRYEDHAGYRGDLPDRACSLWDVGESLLTEAPAGFEPAVRILQTLALPLGHGAALQRLSLPSRHGQFAVAHRQGYFIDTVDRFRALPTLLRH